MADRRTLLATLLGAPAEAPSSPDLTGTPLLLALLAQRTQDVYGAAAGLVADDAEAWVHDIRVATRRLSEAMALAAPLLPQKSTEKVLRRAKRLRTALGAQREADVRIDEAQHLAIECGLDEDVIAQLRSLSGRTTSFSEVLEAHPPEKMLRHGVDILALTLRPLHPGLRLLDLAGPHLYDRVVAVEPLLASVDDPRLGEDHHQIRIRLKRVRYTLELLEEPFALELPAREHLKTLKMLQDRLGELNDAKDLVEWLEQAAVSEVLRKSVRHLLLERAQELRAARHAEARAAVHQHALDLLAELRRAAGLIGRL